MPQIIAVLLMCVVVSMALAACSAFGIASGPGGETTCAEYMALKLPTREEVFTGKRSKEQEGIIKNALSDRGPDAEYGGTSG